MSIQNKCIYKLQSCVWEITLACCFSCRYCGSGAGRARKNELSTEECLDAAEQLAALGCRRVSLIGGEVFMRPDWQCIVKALTAGKVNVSIITNGFLFSEDLIAQLKEAKTESVAISLDGPPRIHDQYRQEGSFQRAVQAIDVLTANAVPVSVISTLHSRNYRCLEEMYDLLKDKPIFAWQLQACSPMGNASGGMFSTAIDFPAVIRFVEQHLDKAPFAIGIADNIGYYTSREGSLRGNRSGEAVFAGCRAGLTGIGIDSVGNVRGCESLYDDRFIEGNLRDSTLAEIWNREDAFAYNRKFRREMLGGKCRTCRYGGICAGGCRSYNYFTHGKLYESLYCAGGIVNNPASEGDAGL